MQPVLWSRRRPNLFQLHDADQRQFSANVPLYMVPLVDAWQHEQSLVMCMSIAACEMARLLGCQAVSCVGRVLSGVACKSV